MCVSRTQQSTYNNKFLDLQSPFLTERLRKTRTLHNNSEEVIPNRALLEQNHMRSVEITGLRDVQ